LKEVALKQFVQFVLKWNIADYRGFINIVQWKGRAYFLLFPFVIFRNSRIRTLILNVTLPLLQMFVICFYHFHTSLHFSPYIIYLLILDKHPLYCSNFYSGGCMARLVGFVNYIELTTGFFGKKVP